MISNEMYLMLGLFIKHLVIDFPLQGPYQYKNKGTYGHPGGLLHAGLHVIGTFVVLICGAPLVAALMLAMIDGIVHYHIDWSKVNINKKFGWGPTTHEEFWYLVGLDQFLHLMTYWTIILAITVYFS
jgi:hypothetical protein